MHLYLTGLDNNRTILTIRGVRNAIRELEPESDATALAKRVVDTFTGTPVLIGETEDEALMDTATEWLDSDSVAYQVSLEPLDEAVPPVDQTAPPAVERSPDEPSYLACRNALAIMAHVGGQPTMAISMLNGMEFVMPDDHPAVTLIQETRQVLFDSFPITA